MAETNGTSNGHDAKERAEALKAEGNAHFQAGRNAEAVEKYNEAIELNPEVPAYYTNRAFCHLKSTPTARRLAWRMTSRPSWAAR